MRDTEVGKLKVICIAAIIGIGLICGTVVVVYSMSNDAERERQILQTEAARERQVLQTEAQREKEKILLEKEQKRPLKMWEKNKKTDKPE
jgi:hypothetical protein